MGRIILPFKNYYKVEQSRHKRVYAFFSFIRNSRTDQTNHGNRSQNGNSLFQGMV